MTGWPGEGRSRLRSACSAGAAAVVGLSFVLGRGNRAWAADWLSGIGTTAASSVAVWLATESRRRQAELRVVSGSEVPWVRPWSDEPKTSVRLQVVNEARFTARAVSVRCERYEIRRGRWEKPSLATGADLPWWEAGYVQRPARAVDIPPGGTAPPRPSSSAPTEQASPVARCAARRTRTGSSSWSPPRTAVPSERGQGRRRTRDRGAVPPADGRRRPAPRPGAQDPGGHGPHQQRGQPSARGAWAGARHGPTHVDGTGAGSSQRRRTVLRRPSPGARQVVPVATVRGVLTPRR